MLSAKQKEKIQKRLGVLKLLHAGKGCWVCGSKSGLKTSRMSVGVRCRRCLEAGASTTFTIEYEQLCHALSSGLPSAIPSTAA